MSSGPGFDRRAVYHRNTLLDRSLIEVGEETYEQFLKALGEPPKILPGMQRLKNIRAPWEDEASERP